MINNRLKRVFTQEDISDVPVVDECAARIKLLYDSGKRRELQYIVGVIDKLSNSLYVRAMRDKIICENFDEPDANPK
jgi:hypothetical protein